MACRLQCLQIAQILQCELEEGGGLLQLILAQIYEEYLNRTS